jgi:hypothetical protein
MNQTAKYIHSALGQQFKPKQSFQELIVRNQMTFEEVKKKYAIRTFSFKPFMMAFLGILCLFLGFIGVENIRYANIRDIDTGKVAYELIQEGYMDQVIAFGPTDYRQLFTIEQIINAQLLRESEVLEVKNYYASQEPKWYIFQRTTYFNIHMGIKDQQDIIIITHLFKPYRMFIIESPLNYTFRSIVEEFETLSGQTLSEDFLHNRYQYSNPEIYSGISMNIIQNEETQRMEVIYRSIIDGIEYEIRK